MTDYAKLARARRIRLKELGLCIECGKQDAQKDKTRCIGCAKASREANERYRKNNPEKVRTMNKNYRSNGKFGYRTRELQKKYRLLLRKKVIEKFGGKCSCCGESTYEFLQIDHLNKDGKQHRSEIGRGMRLHRDMLKDTLKYQIRILCGNCHNAITAHGACPHEIPKNTTCSVQQGSNK